MKALDPRGDAAQPDDEIEIDPADARDALSWTLIEIDDELGRIHDAAAATATLAVAAGEKAHSREARGTAYVAEETLKRIRKLMELQEHARKLAAVALR